MALVRGVMAAREQRRIEVVGARVDVHEDRRGSEQGNGFHGGDEGERRGDHLVACAHAQRHQRDQQRIRAAGAGNAVLGAGARRQPRLQLRHLRPQDELAVGKHGAHARVDLRLQLCVLRLQVDEFHASSRVPWYVLNAPRSPRPPAPSAERRCRPNRCRRR